MMVMAQQPGWRGVLVSPPTMLAEIGGALRRAFPVVGTMRSLEKFSDLLSKLDRRDR